MQSQGEYSEARDVDPLAIFGTDRLSLRSLSEADATLFCGLYADPEAMRFVGQPLSREQAERSFRIVLQSLGSRPIKRLFTVILEKPGQQALGFGALQGIDLYRRRVEAGVMLKPASRGRGFGKESLAALVTRAFALLPVDEVWIEHAADHAIARRVPISLGFSPSREVGVTGKCIWSAYRKSWLSRAHSWA